MQNPDATGAENARPAHAGRGQRIAILGASSQIAGDLILTLLHHGRHMPLLYVRDVAAMQAWLTRHGAALPVLSYAEYGQLEHEAVINFVGVGDPQRVASMGGAIMNITQHYDDLVLGELLRHPERRYIFLSSGAAYGDSFSQPAGPDTPARIPVNAMRPDQFYAVAKLHAECKHRALPSLAITDIRIFNYFSRSQDLAARFFASDIVRAIRDGSVLRTSPDFMVRDFLHPDDLHQIVERILAAPPANAAYDCYSAAPVSKPDLLAAMQARFRLEVEIVAPAVAVVNGTGTKVHYYSTRRELAALGYVPVHTSRDCLLIETGAILGRAQADRLRRPMDS